MVLGRSKFGNRGYDKGGGNSGHYKGYGRGRGGGAGRFGRSDEKGGYGTGYNQRGGGSSGGVGGGGGSSFSNNRGANMYEMQGNNFDDNRNNDRNFEDARGERNFGRGEVNFRGGGGRGGGGGNERRKRSIDRDNERAVAGRKQSRWSDRADNNDDRKNNRQQRSVSNNNNAPSLNGASAGPAPLMANFQPGVMPNFNTPPPGYQQQNFNNQSSNSLLNYPSFQSNMMNGYGFQQQPMQLSMQPPLPRN